VIWKLLAGFAVVYLGWRLWHGWGPLPGTPTPPPEPPMDREEAEARALLGVGRDAGPEEIRAAHRRLVADAHPDRGGSGELARRINAARDRLLKG
jgi:hypothetical protein